MPENIPKLVGEALHESADLARKEFALFGTEMSDNVRTIAMGLVTVIAAAVFAILALIWPPRRWGHCGWLICSQGASAKRQVFRDRPLRARRRVG